MPNNSSYLAEINQAINKTSMDLLGKNPDAKHNRGRILGELFMWTEIERIAKAKKEAARNAAVGTSDDEDRSPGQHELARSPNFVLTATVSQPVNRFDSKTLAGIMKKQYKVPEHATVEAVEKAKVPTKSTVTIKVAEAT